MTPLRASIRIAFRAEPGKHKKFTCRHSSPAASATASLLSSITRSAYKLALWTYKVAFNTRKHNLMR